MRHACTDCVGRNCRAAALLLYMRVPIKASGRYQRKLAGSIPNSISKFDRPAKTLPVAAPNLEAKDCLSWVGLPQLPRSIKHALCVLLVTVGLFLDTGAGGRLQCGDTLRIRVEEMK